MDVRELWRSLGAYGKQVYAITGWRIVATFLLWIVSGVTDAFGLMLLVPLMYTLSGQQSLHATPVLSSIEFLFKAAHINLSLPNILLIGLGLTVVRALLSRKRFMVMEDIRLQFIMKLQIDLFEAAQSAKWSYWMRRRSSDFLHVLTNEVVTVSSGSYYLMHLGVTFFLSLAFWLVALRLSFLLTLCASAAGLLLSVLLRGHLRTSYGLGRSINQGSSSLYDTITQFFNGLKFAKSHGESAMYTRTLTATVQHLTSECEAFVQNKVNVAAVQDICGAAILSAFVYIAYSWLHATLATIILLILIFSRLLPMMSSIFSDAQQVMHMLPAFHTVMETLQSCEKAAEPISEASTDIPHLQEGIRFQRVSVRYEAEHDFALFDINCLIPANKTTALIGQSGAGKTTFADLITGLLEPVAGQVLIDGRPLSSNCLKAWSSRISYVPQEPFLFYGTIRENLTYLASAISDDDIWATLALTAADLFVRKLPNGLDTLIGERGITLSGGERQRLALARALLRKPTLLILDEATSALDGLNEQLIKATLNRLHGQTTVILIAHRLTTVRDADQIIILNNGRIGGVGSWQELSGHAYLNDLLRMQETYS